MEWKIYANKLNCEQLPWKESERKPFRLDGKKFANFYLLFLSKILMSSIFSLCKGKQSLRFTSCEARRARRKTPDEITKAHTGYPQQIYYSTISKRMLSFHLFESGIWKKRSRQGIIVSAISLFSYHLFSLSYLDHKHIREYHFISVSKTKQHTIGVTTQLRDAAVCMVKRRDVNGKKTVSQLVLMLAFQTLFFTRFV